jgi:hypothetical protein
VKIIKTEMRRFIHHPANIPINVSIDSNHVEGKTSPPSNNGVGGLAFLSDQEINPGTRVKIRIPYFESEFITTGKVVWSRQYRHGAALGIEFLSAEDAFQLRMIEQICHIENYRHEVSQIEGRSLTSEEAANEWIKKHSADFPNPEMPPHSPNLN